MSGDGHPPRLVPRLVTQVTWGLQGVLFLLMASWIFFCLGGVRLSPRPSEDGTSNDTSQLFNWHPLLLTLGFPLLMGEALLAYRAPILELSERKHRKYYHFGIHTAALACTITGVVAAFKSHTLKRPTPIPNLYSSHSFLGMTVLALLVAQYLLAASAYLWPKFSLEHRQALGPLHLYLGKAIFAAGCATMAVGIQEKQTFIQAYANPSSVYAAVMRLPSIIQLFLLLTALAVLYHHSAAAVDPVGAAAMQRPHHYQRQGGRGDDEASDAPLAP